MSDLEKRLMADPNTFGLWAALARTQTNGIAGGDQENIQLQLWDHWEVLLAPTIPEIQPNQSQPSV